MRTLILVSVVAGLLLGLQLGCESVEEALGPEEPTEHTQNITANETWSAAGNPHTVTRDITVNNGAILTIEPGTVIKFDADCGITVGGSGPGAIAANGTTDAPITFTSNVSGPAAGDWDGIIFRDQTMDAATVLNNCLIEYGGGYYDYGNVYCDHASPTITNSTIRHSSGYGVYSYDGGFSAFSGNTITQNAQYPVYIHGEFACTLGTDNTLTGNTSDGVVVAGDYITTSGTWLNQGVPYVVDGDLNVADAAAPILTIAAGTTLRFRADAGLFVGQSDPGALVADGSAAQIAFTSDVPFPAAGDWDGIIFRDQTMDAATLLNNCLIEYGGGYYDYGNVFCDHASPTITDCAINYSSGWGIYVYDAAPVLDGNTFVGNADGDVGYNQ